MSESCQHSTAGYASPMEAVKGPRETLMFVTCIAANGGKDYLAIVDVDPSSATFSQVIGRCYANNEADEFHHMGWNACSSCREPNISRSHLILPCLKSDSIYVISVKDQRNPKIETVIDGSKLRDIGVSAPHTAHCLPSGDVMISCMGDAQGNAQGSFILVDSRTFELKGKWKGSEALEEQEPQAASFGYDFWYQLRANVMVSSEWGAPNAFRRGFNADDVQNNLYGTKLNIWDWKKGTIIQELDLKCSMPLEVRFLHDPTKTHGYTGCALGSSIFHFYRDLIDNQWKADKVISIPDVKVQGWMQDQLPALITDILISMDDRFLYFSCWAHGTIYQYDIRDPYRPVLKSRICLGGIVANTDTIEAISDVEQCEQGTVPTQPLFIKGKKLEGGPQMLQLSLDGRRLYVTNSLFSEWDRQFYPSMIKAGSTMILIDVDPENGGMKINEDFAVDFGSEPNGPTLAHEMRYPGGDCTSDIWA